MLPLVFLTPLVASNASLAFPIPKGYTDASAAAVKQTPALAKTGAIVLVKGTSSISIIPTGHMPDADLSDARECTVFANEMKGRLHAESATSSIVDGPSGKTCQIATSYRKPEATVVSTILRGPTNSWMMTCTMTPKDATTTRQVCHDVIGAITFK